tara:strand:- start:404 stop:1507 length:1104 start_codon:yes stop_codon:yes gene_type:complete
MAKKTELIISFVHGYQNENLDIQRRQVPALIRMNADDKEIIEIINLEFPRTPKDFLEFSNKILGENPLPGQVLEFKKLPRFGIMGLTFDENHIYAASWNGIYKLNKKDYRVEGLISHRLISDSHGIDVKDNKIYSILPSLDLVVISDKVSGEILDFFSIDRELNVIRDDEVLAYDWRFISKQERGAVGNWHFNHIRVSNDKIYLTSRLASSVIEIDQYRTKATIRTVCWDTPVMLHDGRLLGDDELVFTSVDGKILIANDAKKKKSEMHGIEDTAFHLLMKRDMVNTSIRIGDILGKEINWCRGIEEYNGKYITTTDGRYDQEYPYFNIAFVQKDGSHVDLVQVPYTLLEFPEQIRYMTGFSVLALN